MRLHIYGFIYTYAFFVLPNGREATIKLTLISSGQLACMNFNQNSIKIQIATKVIWNECIESTFQTVATVHTQLFLFGYMDEII